MYLVNSAISHLTPKQSQLDKKMHRRSFQKHLDELKMPYHYTGFTNRILIQQPDNKTINYFIPVYVIFKIKSIQDIDVQKLVGSISCVIIINVRIENLPEQIVNLLETGMNIQLNRSELIELKESQQNNISKSKKDKMLTFTLRKTVTGTILQDTLWSPFEIIRLIVSLTFNSIKKDGQEIMHQYLQRKTKQKEEKNKRIDTIVKELGETFMRSNSVVKQKKPKDQIEFDSLKKYSIMFNSMRCGAEIPISYAIGCVYSLYDLAEKKLESYHTHFDSYNQLRRNYEQAQDKQNNKKLESSNKSNVQENTGQNASSFKKPAQPQSPINIEVQDTEQKKYIVQYISQIYKQQKGDKEEKDAKPKYYQYTHIVIPLYKYPGNSLATIFIPIFLLALLSLAIFYQDNELSSRIGSIATLVLGYIALIPSIKQQLPPSSKITIIERVIYLSTLCCLLSLIQSFTVDGIQDYVFKWNENTLFLLCLYVHSSIFIFILALLAIHKLVWQKSYNHDQAVKSPDPEKENQKWVNVYCDQDFFSFNNKMYEKNQKNQKETDKSKGLIKKYVPKIKKVEEKEKNTQNDGLDMLSSLIGQKKKQKKSTDNTTLQSEASTITESKVTDKAQKSQVVDQKKQVPVKKEEKKVQKKQNQGKGEKGKGDNKPKKILQYQTSLQYLDELISKGSHINIRKKEKKQPEPAKDPNNLQKKNK